MAHTAILLTLALLAVPARALAVDDECLTTLLQVTVIGLYDTPVGSATLKLKLADSEGPVKEPVLSARADDTGVARFKDVPCGTYDLAVVVSGYPAKNVRVDVTRSLSPVALTITMGVPCDGETGAPIALTDNDRASILSDLLAKTEHYHDATVLLDRNIDSLKLLHDVPSRLVALKEKDLIRRSRRHFITFVELYELKVRGSCVVAEYWITCVKNGQYCGLCCEGATYSYRRENGRWTGTYVTGVVASSSYGRPTSDCSGARAAGLDRLFFS